MAPRGLWGNTSSQNPSGLSPLPPYISPGPFWALAACNLDHWLEAGCFKPGPVASSACLCSGRDRKQTTPTKQRHRQEKQQPCQHPCRLCSFDRPFVYHLILPSGPANLPKTKFKHEPRRTKLTKMVGKTCYAMAAQAGEAG